MNFCLLLNECFFFLLNSLNQIFYAGSNIKLNRISFLVTILTTFINFSFEHARIVDEMKLSPSSIIMIFFLSPHFDSQNYQMKMKNSTRIEYKIKTRSETFDQH